MKIEAYTCPNCGAALDVERCASFAFCPHCGSKLHITYEKEESGPVMRTFKTPDGLPVAQAVVPSNYTLKAFVSPAWQSDLNAVVSHVNAESMEEGVIISSASKEVFYDVRSAAIKVVLGLISTHTKAGIMPFVPVDQYVRNWAEKIAGIPLRATSVTSLPSAKIAKASGPMLMTPSGIMTEVIFARISFCLSLSPNCIGENALYPISVTASFPILSGITTLVSKSL